MNAAFNWDLAATITIALAIWLKLRGDPRGAALLGMLSSVCSYAAKVCRGDDDDDR